MQASQSDPQRSPCLTAGTATGLQNHSNRRPYSLSEGRRVACRTDPDTAPGRHASPFGSVVTGSRELTLPDFPRDYPPAHGLTVAGRGGLPRYEPVCTALHRAGGKLSLPDKEFRLK